MVLTIESFMPSDEECARALREVRWAVALICLYCGSGRVARRGWRKGLYQRYIARIVGDGSTIELALPWPIRGFL